MKSKSAMPKINQKFHFDLNHQSESMEIFKSLVEFIGKHDTKISSLNDAILLYQAGKKYEIPDLEERCLKYINGIIKHSNVCQIYEFAKDKNQLEIIEKCQNLVCWEIIKILSTEGFLRAKLETILWIYKMDDLIIDSELQLFKGLEEWMTKNFPEMKNGTGLIKKVLYSIRFLSLSPNEFVINIVSSNLLTSEDKLAILSLIVSPECNVKVSHEFCLKRERKMVNQDKFVAEFSQLLSSDIASSEPTQCIDCDKIYSGYYIDHLLFVCTNTSMIDRNKMINIVLGSKDPETGEIIKEFFDTKPYYQKALFRYIKMNFNWIQLNENIYNFEM